MEDIIAFIEEMERLKDGTRTSWTSNDRHESIAEHSWRAAMLALALEREFPSTDMDRVIRMLLVHDMGEIYSGDISATIKTSAHKDDERQDMVKAASILKGREGEEMIGLWEEYERNETDEAKLAKAIDKIETIIQHNQTRSERHDEIKLQYNLEYGRRYTDFSAVTRKLREMIDSQTRRNLEGHPPKEG